MAISIVAGLGNPGEAYEGTRHNAGFMLLDALGAEHSATAEWVRDRRSEVRYAVIRRSTEDRLFLAKPWNYVNNSGKELSAFCGFYKLPSSSIVVAYDEVNLPLGRVKISIGGSDGGHNGVADLMRFIPNDFIRFRIGIGPKHPPGTSLTHFVLGRFRPEEKKLFDGAMTEMVEGLKLLIDSGPEVAMNRINRRSRDAGKETENASTNRTEENDSNSE